jgi:hypothetical protein
MRSKIVSEILNKLWGEPWYDKVRRNINFMFNYGIYRNPFYRVFGKK